MNGDTSPERYVLATGAEGEDRLELVEAVHGGDTRALLQKAGVAAGMRVADIGCGIGSVTCVLATMVMPGGEAVGVDISPEQVEIATRRASAAGIGNVRFVVGSAYGTGLDAESFDVVYARFLLMHLARPRDALQEMLRILKRGGTIIVEDGDFTAPYCVPSSPAFAHCFELYRETVRRQGANPEIGPELTSMLMSAGLGGVNVSIVQPVISSGPGKSLPAATLAEAGPIVLGAGLATRSELEALVLEMKRLEEDPSTTFGMAQMTQVWGRKP